MVLTLPEWRELDQSNVLKLCAEKYSWRCYFFTARREAKDQDWRLTKELHYMNYHSKNSVTWGSSNRWHPPTLL